jgi:hypothetical protein
MKNTLKISFLLAFLFVINIYAQNSINVTEVKSALTNLFDLCKNKNYENASAYLAYDGKDVARKEKSSFNYSEKSEKKIVKRKCKKIKAYLDLSDSYEYGKFSSGGNKADINVIFKSGDQELKIMFSFVKVGNKILLSNFK